MKEKIILMEVYKRDGKIGVDLPNEKDVLQFELYGFLEIYLRILKKGLSESFEVD